MFHHQILHIGEELVPAVIEYSHDEDMDVFVIDKIVIVNGPAVPVGIFEIEVIEDMMHCIALGHDRVISDLDAKSRADRAQDRDAFRAAYGD